MKNLRDVLKINRLFHLIVLLGAFSVVNLFSMRMTEKSKIRMRKLLGLSQREAEINKKRGILIFLDEQEKDEFGAVSYSLLTALYQEAGLIIVSTSLLYNLHEYWQKDNRPIEDLLNDPLLDRPRQEAKSFLNTILSRVCFKEERWIIKKINSSLSLLMPLRYLESLHIAQDAVKEFDISTGANVLSEAELQLGLKINHMEIIDFNSIHIPFYTRFSTYFFSSLADYFVDSLDTVFCKKSDYRNRRMNIPEWCIFIDGHGAMKQAIAYLSLNDFKKFLYFLETEIITQLLVVTSCYAAGVNVNQMYGELKLGTQQYYSFPIIVQGLNDIPTGGRPLSIDWNDLEQNKKVSLDTELNFLEFLKRAKHLESNYNEIIKPLLKNKAGNLIENIPQIKLPGIEWFSVMNFNRKIVSIGSVFAKTRDPQKPLDLVKQNPNAILLYTDDIPFELKVNFFNIRILSMVSSGPMRDKPEFVINRIRKISSNIASNLSWLLSDFIFEYPKWFFIDSVYDGRKLYKDVVLFVAESGRTVLTQRPHIKCYCKDENNDVRVRELWKHEKDEMRKANVLEKEDYETKMNVVREYFKLKEKEAQHEISPERLKAIENVLTEQQQFKNIKNRLIKQHEIQMQEVQKQF